MASFSKGGLDGGAADAICAGGIQSGALFVGGNAGADGSTGGRGVERWVDGWMGETAGWEKVGRRGRVERGRAEGAGCGEEK